MTPFKRRAGYLLLLLCLALNTGQAVYIYAKAELAQVLIAHAWQQQKHQQQPLAPWPWADTFAVAKLTVPKLNIEQYVLAGTGGNSLAFGPGWLIGSADIGVGTSILAGHKDTHFSFLQYLNVGDNINVQTTDGNNHSYRVSSAKVVNIHTQPLSLGNNDKALILISCYPFNSIRSNDNLRYRIHATPTNTIAML